MLQNITKKEIFGVKGCVLSNALFCFYIIIISIYFLCRMTESYVKVIIFISRF